MHLFGGGGGGFVWSEYETLESLLGAKGYVNRFAIRSLKGYESSGHRRDSGRVTRTGYEHTQSKCEDGVEGGPESGHNDREKDRVVQRSPEHRLQGLYV
jgi:hypothetical protein